VLGKAASTHSADVSTSRLSRQQHVCGCGTGAGGCHCSQFWLSGKSLFPVLVHFVSVIGPTLVMALPVIHAAHYPARQAAVFRGR
jgi:hypothetical protein